MQTTDNNQEEIKKEQDQEIESQNNKCENELKQTKEVLLRLTADFENYKRRVNKEKVNWIQDAQAEIVQELLPIIDDFDRAMSEYKKKDQVEDLKNWIIGFELIHKAFQKFLEKNNIKEISNLNFDPEYHEAIAQIDSEKESGTIIEVVQKGYLYGDKVLRPAKVIVAK